MSGRPQALNLLLSGRSFLPLRRREVSLHFGEQSLKVLALTEHFERLACLQRATLL